MSDTEHNTNPDLDRPHFVLEDPIKYDPYALPRPRVVNTKGAFGRPYKGAKIRRAK